MAGAAEVSKADRRGIVQGLDQAVDEFAERLELLSKTLEPILEPEGPEAMLETLSEGIQSPMENRVERLDRLNNRLANLTHRIRL